MEETHPLVSKPIRHRHTDIREEQLSGVLCVETHLVEVAASFEPIHTVFDDEEREATVRIFRCAHDDNDEVCIDAAGDERLGTIDHIVIPLETRRCCYSGQIGPGPRFGHGERRHEITAREAGNPPLLLFGSAIGEEVRDADVVVQRDTHAGRACARRGEHLVDDRVVAEVVDTTSSVFPGDRHAEEPGSTRLAEHLLVDLARCTPLGVIRQYLDFEEPLDRRPEQIVLGFEDGAFHGRHSLGSLVSRYIAPRMCEARGHSRIYPGGVYLGCEHPG